MNQIKELIHDIEAGMVQNMVAVEYNEGGMIGISFLINPETYQIDGQTIVTDHQGCYRVEYEDSSNPFHILFDPYVSEAYQDMREAQHKLKEYTGNETEWIAGGNHWEGVTI